MRIRRLLSFAVLIAIAVGLIFLLRHRKRQFIAAQVVLLQSDDPDQATAARRRLQPIGRSAVRPVCALLQHKDADVRARAALTLANIGHPAACGPLMAAAKRGGFPAADALEFMKHPQASAARAAGFCWLGDTQSEELCRSLPGGSAPPAAAWRRWQEPSQQFRPVACSSLEWPGAYGWSDHPLVWLRDAALEAELRYQHALETRRSPEALVGKARIGMLCGEYVAAASFYASALQWAPDSEAARAGQTEAEGLVALQGKMDEVSGWIKPLDGVLRGPPRKHFGWPAFLDIGRILSHPTWRQGDREYRVAVAGGGVGDWSVLYEVPKLVLYSSRGQSLRQIGNPVPVFSMDELATTYYPPRAYAGLLEPGPGDDAAVVAVRPLDAWRLAPDSYGLSLYDLTERGLVQTLDVPSTFIPWLGDLDEDGDTEIVTWHCPTCDEEPPNRAPWPIVRTLVDGHYELASKPFPRLHQHLARVLAEREHRYPQDPHIADYLGRAHEITGETELAIAACQRAEQKYRAKAVLIAHKGQMRRARRHREAAEAVKQRRLRLQSEGGVG